MTNPDDSTDWLQPGTAIKHGTFGTGTVRRLFDYKGVPSISIDFDYGARKALAVEYATPHLSPLRRFARRTPTDPNVRCGICGKRPVVFVVEDQQFCEAHAHRYRPVA